MRDMSERVLSDFDEAWIGYMRSRGASEETVAEYLRGMEEQDKRRAAAREPMTLAEYRDLGWFEASE